MDSDARRIRFRSANAMGGRPDWLVDFRAWLAGLSPSAIADLLDVLALELAARNGGEPFLLDEVAKRVRTHHGARVRELVDDFLRAQGPAARCGSRLSREPFPLRRGAG